jgi:rod shape determining protein RodA
VGALVVLALYGFLVFWIINVALAARDKFGSALCVGVAAMVFWHFLVNIAMVLGMAPVVGMTLPLVSYGGSSLVTFFVALGLVSSVSMRRHGF